MSWLQATVVIYDGITYTSATPLAHTATLDAWPPPAQTTNPDGSPSGGALYKAGGPAIFTDGNRSLTFLALDINVGQPIG
ncbi:hypothetical protein ACBR40_27325 [Nonomuraea sp. AD125B]|uniref:hypothetical protein n=1 Tax=Nonomuraea sp. AD125B TaxID=3242897 RepID=UPI003527192A